MNLYDIHNKGTGAYITSIRLAELHEVGNFTFDLYEYRDVTPGPDDELPPGLPPRFGGRRLLTKLEWRKLLTPEENGAFDKLRANVETMVLPSEELRDEIRTAVNMWGEATVMDLDDPAQERGFGLMVALGKMAPYRIKEILNG